MGKTVRFDIESNEPQGSTFEGNKFPKLAGSSNTKRKANFGVRNGEPNGTTFVANKSHISMPNADQTPKESKVISSAGGQGSTYKPARSGPKDFGGSVGVGTSSPKKGRTDSTKARW